MFNKVKNRMRFWGAAILFGLSAVLAGCADAGDAVGVFPQDIKKDGTEAPLHGGETGRKESSSQGSGTGETGRLPQSVPLSELPKYVFRTGDGHLLLLGDTVSLMNVHTLETEVCREETGLDFSFQDFSSCKFAASEDGYLVMGNYLKLEKEGENFYSSSEAPKLMLVRFSKSLEVLEVLDIGKAAEAKREIDRYDFTHKGENLLCASLEECFLYDRKKGTRTSYPLTEGRLKGVTSLGYMEGADKILFTASYDDGSRDYRRVLGSLRPDGTELKYEKKQTHEWGEIWCFQDFALIEDGKLHENGEKGSVFYCNADGKITEHTLADEYTAIRPSDTGKYFSVQSKTWAEDGNNTGYMVRVYESEDGRLIQEIACPSSEIGNNTMLCECIVSEEAGAVLLLMCGRGTDGDLHYGENARFSVVKLEQ